jgi:hypothetical protein
MTDHGITTSDVKKAHKAFQTNEPRDLFYRAATVLVDLALRRPTSLTVAEALAVLLQTWNKAYYQYHRKFDNAHFAKIERLLSKNQRGLARYRKMAIDRLHNREGPDVAKLFHAFESVLGPVGAAKALHLLAPRLFPIWDRTIAKAYGLALRKAGSNGDRYWQFVLKSKEQCIELKRDDRGRKDPLKAIDEYNYCKYTKKWIL